MTPQQEHKGGQQARSSKQLCGKILIKKEFEIWPGKENQTAGQENEDKRKEKDTS